MLPDMNHAWPAHERHMYLGHDNKFIARQVQLLDGVPKNDFREPVRIHLHEALVQNMPTQPERKTHVGGVESLDTVVIPVACTSASQFDTIASRSRTRT